MVSYTVWGQKHIPFAYSDLKLAADSFLHRVWIVPAAYSTTVLSPRVLVKLVFMHWLFPKRGSLVASFSPYIPYQVKAHAVKPHTGTGYWSSLHYEYVF